MMCDANDVIMMRGGCSNERAGDNVVPWIMHHGYCSWLEGGGGARGRE